MSGKVDKKRLKSLFRSGMANKDIAEYFGVTPGAISQHTANMKRSEVRAVVLEKGASIYTVSFRCCVSAEKDQ